MRVVVPDLGDFADVEIIEILVKAGDVVAPEDPLISLETEKAAMDVPSPTGGTVKSVEVAVGDKVSAGDLIAVIDADETAEAATAGDADKPKQTPAGAPAGATKPAGEAERAESPRPAAPAGSQAPDEKRGSPSGPAPSAGRFLMPVDEAGFSRAHASPSVRKLGRELGVDLGRVDGSGAKGRVTAADVKAYV